MQSSNNEWWKNIFLTKACCGCKYEPHIYKRQDYNIVFTHVNFFAFMVLCLSVFQMYKSCRRVYLPWGLSITQSCFHKTECNLSKTQDRSNLYEYHRCSYIHTKNGGLYFWITFLGWNLLSYIHSLFFFSFKTQFWRKPELPLQLLFKWQVLPSLCKVIIHSQNELKRNI